MKETDEQFEKRCRMEKYEDILSKIPYGVIEEHLERRREENKDYLKWVPRDKRLELGSYEVAGVRKAVFPDEL